MARKKKVAVVAEMEKEVTNITLPLPSLGEKLRVILETPTYDEYAVSVVAPKGFPDARETISKTKYVPGSWLYAPEVYEGKHSFLSETEDKKALCIALLQEIDKGATGAFHDAYFMNADLNTPGLGQYDNFKVVFAKHWKGDEAPSEAVLQAQFGLHMRIYWRQIVFRFLGYYMMGYTVTFTKA